MARLYNWYIEKKNKMDPNSELWARGVVSGHVRLPDGLFIHTSTIASVTIEGETAIIQTQNTRFECKMENADYVKFKETQLIDDFPAYKAKYAIPKVKYKPDLKENEVLLVLGNNRQYYFDSYHVNYEGTKESLYDVHPHIGMFQDSVLCQCFINRQCIDYRYFPYKGCHAEFYSWEDHFKTYIENCGDDPLYVTVYGNVYVIPAKERVLIIPQNAEKEEPHLGHTDLYDVWHRENEQKEEENINSILTH